VAGGGTGLALERSAVKGEQVRAGHPRVPAPAPATPLPLCVPPSSKHNRPRTSFPQGDSSRAAPGTVSPPRRSSTATAPFRGQGKTIESNAKLSNHRELWVRADTVQNTRQNSSTEAHRPGGPASSQYPSYPRPCFWTFCTPSQLPPSAQPICRGGRVRMGARPAARHVHSDGVQSLLSSSKRRGSNLAL